MEEVATEVSGEVVEGVEMVAAEAAAAAASRTWPAMSPCASSTHCSRVTPAHENPESNGLAKSMT